MGGAATSDPSVVFATRDLPIAAYVQIHGLTIVKAEKLAGGKFEFVFKDPDSRGEQLEIDFVNSECQRFDSAVRGLKKLCYRRG